MQLLRALVPMLLLVPACGARSVAWKTAMTDTDCHAADTIVRKNKTAPDTFDVYACGQDLTYRCEASGACVRAGTTEPTPTIDLSDPVAPSTDAPDPEPVPEDTPASEDPPASDASPAPQDAPADATDPGAVPEPP